MAFAMTAHTLGARAETIDGTLDYVALGDSYASGHGASTTYVDNACKRSTNAYPNMVFRKYKAVEQPSGSTSLVSRACTGATIADIVTHQVAYVQAHTRLVTLTAGGNDVGFASAATTCVLHSSADCTMALNNLAVKLDSVRRPLTDLLVSIKRQALTANVVVSGYPRIFDTGDCGLLAISEANRDRMRSLQQMMNQIIQQAAADSSAQFADPDPLFEGHRVCDSDHWINQVSDAIVGGDPTAAYHPNQDGQAAMAEVVFRAAIGSGVH
jgi:lysophospholipase L1-like esterase